MTQDLSVGFYVIGVFDILGQSRKLRSPMGFSPETKVAEQAMIRNLRATAGAVDQFRQLFRRQFTQRQQTFEQDAAAVPEAQRATFRAALAPRILTWGMSDTQCVAVPLEAGSGAVGAMATFADVRRSLQVVALTWLVSLAEGVPFRGGIELGSAVRMRENDIYGKALIDAYHLESKVAKWPRIVVGETLVGALRDASQDPDVAFRGAAMFAEQCCSMLRQDVDGHTAVDVLADGVWSTLEHRRSLRNEFVRAHSNVRSQLRSHQEAGCTKLISRYGTLLAYFDEYAPIWREQ